MRGDFELGYLPRDTGNWRRPPLVLLVEVLGCVGADCRDLSGAVGCMTGPVSTGLGAVSE